MSSHLWFSNIFAIALMSWHLWFAIYGQYMSNCLTADWQIPGLKTKMTCKFHPKKWRKHFLTSGANISWQVAQTFLDKWRKISLKMAQTFLNKWHKHFLTSGSNISWKMAQTFLWTKTLLFLLVIGVKKFGYCPVDSVHHPNCCVRNGKQMELFSPCYQRYFCV